jgi:hypothetical protein
MPSAERDGPKPVDRGDHRPIALRASCDGMCTAGRPIRHDIISRSTAFQFDSHATDLLEPAGSVDGRREGGAIEVGGARAIGDAACVALGATRLAKHASSAGWHDAAVECLRELLDLPRLHGAGLRSERRSQDTAVVAASHDATRWRPTRSSVAIASSEHSVRRAWAWSTSRTIPTSIESSPARSTRVSVSPTMVGQIQGRPSFARRPCL